MGKKCKNCGWDGNQPDWKLCGRCGLDPDVASQQPAPKMTPTQPPKPEPSPPKSSPSPTRPAVDRKWITTLLLSIFLGFWGADRFYLRQYRWGVWKLMTLGGFGWWWFADLVYFAIRRRNFSVAVRNEPPHQKYSKRIAICSTILPIVLFLVFQVTVGSFKVYGSSMLPTIEDGDYIIVSKATYFFHQPQRGDIIVHRLPKSPQTDRINRIIAVPGDTVEIRDDTVFINGTALVEPYTLEPPHYLVFPEEIPSGQYFVLGDNRNNSSDSHRGWTVSRENIIGKLWIIYWPPYRWRAVPHYVAGVGRQAAVPDKPTSSPDSTVPTSGVTNIIFEDDFSDPWSGWAVDSVTNGKAGYLDGKYQLLEKSGGYSLYGRNTEIGQFDDFVLEVDAQWHGTPSSSNYYGIVFREQDNDDRYALYVSSDDGYYALTKTVNGTGSALKDWTTASTYIKKGTSVNRLKVVCAGPQISVYVNNSLLTTVYDSSLSRGYIGLMVGKGESTSSGITVPDADAVFDNLKIFAL